MSLLKINELTQKAIDNFNLPKDLGFGQVMAPVMVQWTYKEGKWQDLKLLPYGPISLSPTAKVLHYAQEIFEGLKAYKVDGLGPYLFRPLENAKRFNLSAARMAMPLIDPLAFVDIVKEYAQLNAAFIPTQSGQSLYIRPFMFANEAGLGIKPAGEFLFMVIASPSGAYISGESMKVLIQRKEVRAISGGTGHAKTGGNYARSLKSSLEAQELGLNQTLWLDGRHRRYIEELSGMNFFAVINGELHTPLLTDTILKGITRESIIQLAKDEGLRVREVQMDIGELIEQIKTNQCSEAFACGTAAIITPIALLSEDNKEHYKLPQEQGPIGQKLRSKLLQLQEGKSADPYGWRVQL